MANLYGTGINQVPTNGMLGNLAFQDKAYVSVDRVGIGSTFVDSGTANQILQVYGGGAFISGSVGIGSTNPTEKLTVSGKIQILQDSGSNNRLVLRGQPASSYRWSVDNYGSSNDFRIFREDDSTAANGSVAVSISTTGTVTATKFSGDGSLLTNLGSSQWVTTSVGIHTLSYVGIGTTNPSQKLEVVGGEIKAGRIDSSSEGGQLSFGRATDNNTAWYVDVYGSTSTPDLRFVDVSNAAIRAVIDGSGNFGIKNASPTSALDVSGDAKVSGVVTATSFIGSGTNLTGIVTSIVAGTNITVSGSTGQVTINSTATPLDILEVMLFA